MNVEHDVFAEIVEEALESLPEEFSRRLENVEVVIEDEPSEEVLRELGLPRGSLLGLFHGVPLKHKSVLAGPTLPAKISIYRIPILAISRTREEVWCQIRRVVIHEIGHHFGLSDREMSAVEGEPPGGTRGERGAGRAAARRGQKR